MHFYQSRMAYTLRKFIFKRLNNFKKSLKKFEKSITVVHEIY